MKDDIPSDMQPSLRLGDLSKATALFPAITEQTAIADYLDEKTALLDSTITAKKKQIKLLKERRIALINKAVMQGIDEGVEMKESGVEWIGKVPKVWEVNRIGSCFLERKRKVSDKDFSALSVTKNGIVPQLENAAKTDDGDNRKLIKKGDFVINSRSDRKGSSGTSNFEGSTSLISIVLKSVKLAPQFTHFLFRSDSFIEEYYRMGRGIVADLWTTRYKEMKNINIAFPSKIEQIKIANYLDFEIVKINETMALIEKSIALLEEYKASLVSHVVTGKIKIS
jgi:type I restriction enzyme S subunit